MLNWPYGKGLIFSTGGNDETLESPAEDGCSSSSPKVILWFDIYNQDHGVRIKAKEVNFQKCTCPCVLKYFTIPDDATDKVYGPLNGDAILMQLAKLRYLHKPPKRLSNQVLVAVEREAHGLDSVDAFNDAFNWTMTFRQDSDIYYPYGRVMINKGKKRIKNYSEIFKDKVKGVSWFVSHCETRSKRELFVEELSKYIPVDIYGACGKDICPRHGKGAAKCITELTKKYMFRIAIENTCYQDYITEKFFDWFNSDIVLVVLGAGNYSNIAPKGTYINANDFESPRDLVKYLNALMHNKAKYIGYLQRKENYTAENLRDSSQRAYCELCRRLHNPKGYQKTYTNISDWWNQGFNVVGNKFLKERQKTLSTFLRQ